MGRSRNGMDVMGLSACRMCFSGWFFFFVQSAVAVRQQAVKPAGASPQPYCTCSFWLACSASLQELQHKHGPSAAHVIT